MDAKVVVPLDGNGSNCRVENLALITLSGLRLKRYGKGRFVSKLHSLPIERQLAIHKKADLKKRVKINKYTPGGTLITSYPGLTIAARKNKVSVGCVGTCAQKRIKILKGCVFRYASEGYRGELQSWNGKKLRVVQYSPEGKLLRVFNSIKEAAQAMKTHPNCVSNCANKKAKHAAGYVWRFEGDIYKGENKKALKKTKVVQLSLSGREFSIVHHKQLKRLEAIIPGPGGC